MNKENKHIDLQIITRCIAGEAKPEEQKALKAWLAEDKAHQQEYDQLKKTWDALGMTNPKHEINIDQEWEDHQQLLKGSSVPVRSLFSNPFVRIAAVLVILMGVAVLWRYNFTGQEGPVAQKQQGIQVMELADGSRVTLNVGSHLKVVDDFGNANRSVSLEGEAYFEVAKDSLRPFIIQMGNAEIEVLGTEFNVRAYENMDRIEVTVTEGKVSLYDKKKMRKKVMAVGGERAEYKHSDGTVVKVENADQNYLAWKTGSMVFENDSLKYVIEVIGRVYHREIILKDDASGKCPVTNSFENKTLDTVLEVLESTLDLTREETKDAIYLSGSGCD